MKRNQKVVVLPEGTTIVPICPFEFYTMLGLADYHMKYVGSHEFSIGEVLQIVPMGSDGEKPRSLFCRRYVHAIEDKYALMLDDFSATIILSPFKPASI